MTSRCALILLILAVFACDAAALEPLSARDYTALRKKYASAIPVDTLRADAPSYIGKYFEVRGVLTGVSKNAAGCVAIVTTAGQGSYLINCGDSIEGSPGAEIVCLARIGEGCAQSMSDLRLVGWTYGADLRALEESWQRAAEAKAARESEARRAVSAQPTSRGGTDGGRAAEAAVSSHELVRVYTSAVKGFNPRLTDAQADTIARSILGFSQRYQVDPRLVCAVILAESNFRVDATSRAGAQGLGQLMPSTAAGLGVTNAYDPVENVYGSVRYIRSMLDRMSGAKTWNELTWYDLALALAAYNAGPGAVKKHGGIPPYKETRSYVQKVTSIYKQLCGVR